jgi:hypothetical protein
MTWNPPDTPWTTNMAITVARLQQFADSIYYLFRQRPLAKSVTVGTGDISTTSTTFISTGLAITITPKSTRVKVTCTFTAYITPAGGTVSAEFDLYSNSLAVRFGDATHGMIAISTSSPNAATLVAYFEGLTPNVSQTFTLMMRTTNASSTAAIAYTGHPVSMMAEEI